MKSFFAVFFRRVKRGGALFIKRSARTIKRRDNNGITA